jgi:hypothetical protein
MLAGMWVVKVFDYLAEGLWGGTRVRWQSYCCKKLERGGKVEASSEQSVMHAISQDGLLLFFFLGTQALIRG